MSTDYIITTPIPMPELFGERLKKYSIRDAQSPEATHDVRCLTDGENNYLWAYGNPVTGFTRYMPNGWPGFILQAIATEFGVEIYSEHALYYEQVSQEEAKPSYVPLDTPPTDEAIVLMRAQSRAEREALDQELEALLVARRGKEIAPAG